MRPSVQRVHDALVAAGVEPRIVEFSESTHTAMDAAAAIGTSVAQIVKSLVFLADGEPLIVLASGPNRVDTARLGRAIGKRIKRAEAQAVRDATGFAIGGVAPVGFPNPVPVVVDPDLLDFDVVWAAAGTPNTVFPIAPADLRRITEASVYDIKVE